MRARVGLGFFGFGLGSGSGLAIFVSEPVGLLNFAIKYCAKSRIYLELRARACLGFQKRLWNDSGPGLIGLWAYVVRAQHQARDKT